MDSNTSIEPTHLLVLGLEIIGVRLVFLQIRGWFLDYRGFSLLFSIDRWVEMRLCYSFVVGSIASLLWDWLIV